jgi:peptide/nickel transport system substrate-binding protein
MKRIRLTKRCAALVLASCASAFSASAETVLRIKMTGDLQQIDPIWTTSYPVRDMSYLIYDTLFSTDANYEVRPQMVDAWSLSGDGLTYTLTLRAGLSWHDGKPVTATDCIASLERWMQKDTLGGVLRTHLDKFEKVDERTFKLVLKEPWDLTLAALGKISSYVPFMMPERLARTPPDKANTEAIGSGPYMMKMDEWVPGSKIVYVKNPKHVPRAEPPSMMAGGKIAGVDRIERIVIPDDVSAVNALIAGEIDYIEAIPPDLMALVENNPDIVVSARGSLGNSAQIVLNHLQPPLDNQKVRQAVQYAIGQKEIMRAFNGDRTDLYQVCPSLLYCGGVYSSDVNSERAMAHDPAKARALLKEANYDGRPLVIMHPTDQKWQDDVVTVVVQQLRKAGFTVEDRPIDVATMFSWRTKKEPANAGGWHIFNTGWSGVDLMNPATNVFMTGACDKAWFGWACDKELQVLRAAFFEAKTDAERKDVAVKLQARAHDVVPYVSGGQNLQMAAWRKSVKGVIDSPVPILWNVSKEK